MENIKTENVTLEVLVSHLILGLPPYFVSVALSKILETWYFSCKGDV